MAVMHEAPFFVDLDLLISIFDDNENIIKYFNNAKNTVYACVHDFLTVNG